MPQLENGHKIIAILFELQLIFTEFRVGKAKFCRCKTHDGGALERNAEEWLQTYPTKDPYFFLRVVRLVWASFAEVEITYHLQFFSFSSMFTCKLS